MVDKLKKVFGEQAVRDVKSAGGCVAIVQPNDLSAAAELVRFARDNNIQIVPVGSRTKMHWVDAPKVPFIEMDMRGCSRIIEYSPSDMTVTVEAGITLDALSQTLAENGQRLTLDPPYADRATIGGILAANDSGPIRTAYGSARDIVIGMSMIEPDGTLIRSGGKVVKNVAGYDLHRLYIGSFGTLGPIATVTFKLRPIPESRRVVVLHPVNFDDAERMVAGVIAGPTRPTFCVILNAVMAKSMELPPRPTLLIGFEENAEAAQWQAERIRASLGGDITADGDTMTVYKRLREAPVQSEQASFKATMLSSKVAAFYEKFDHLPIRMISWAAIGIVFGVPFSPLDESVWRKLSDAVNAGQGGLHIRGPLPSSHLVRFSPRRKDWLLSERIQKAFDPIGTFAPQRLFATA